MASELMGENEQDGRDGPDVLTEKERAFCEHFTDASAPATFGNPTAAALAAGYASVRDSVWRLMRRPRVRERIGEMLAAQTGPEAVLASLEIIRRLSLAVGDLQVATRVTELLAKTNGMFVDRVIVDLPAQHEYDARLEAECHALARVRLEQAGKAGLGASEDAARQLLEFKNPESELERK